MTTKDKFADVHERLMSLARDLEDATDARDVQRKKDAHLAAHLFRLVEQFYTDGRISMPEGLKEKLHQFIEVGTRMGEIERDLFHADAAADEK